MAEWFHVGQQVVHVKDLLADRRRGNIAWPEDVIAGRILTIRDIDRRYIDWYGVLGLRFEEISFGAKNCGINGMVEPAFPADRFRPCRKTDISVFAAALVTTPRELVEM